MNRYLMIETFNLTSIMLKVLICWTRSQWVVGYILTLFAVETFGPWGLEAKLLVDCLGSRLNKKSGDRRARFFLSQQMSNCVNSARQRDGQIVNSEISYKNIAMKKGKFCKSVGTVNSHNIILLYAKYTLVHCRVRKGRVSAITQCHGIIIIITITKLCYSLYVR